jgi:putative nucleotidyltransferase with HDIG domain
VRLVSTDDFSFARVSALIRADAAFSAEVLRITNSPLFGLRRRIDNILQALTMLGAERLKSLVLTVGLRNYLSKTLHYSALRRCWRHSLACACACEELAAAARMGKDSVYTAGLLHDIGRLGMLASYPGEYARMLDVDEECGFDVLESERDLFDLDHCEAGNWLVREWGLPVEFEQITSKHHAEPVEGRSDPLTLVQLACRISGAMGFGVVSHGSPTMDEIWEKLPRGMSEKLGPQEEFVVRIGEKTTGLERDLLI